MDELAQQIALDINDVGTQGVIAVDPTLVAIIIQIVMQLLEQLDDCKTTELHKIAHQCCTRRGLIVRWRTYRAVRQQLGEDAETALVRKLGDQILQYGTDKDALDAAIAHYMQD